MPALWYQHCPRFMGVRVGQVPSVLSRNLKTSNQQKELTMSNSTPIIGRDALLSLVDWVNTMRRKQDERKESGELGLRDEDSGGSQTPDRGAICPHDAAVSGSHQIQQGGHGEDGA